MLKVLFLKNLTDRQVVLACLFWFLLISFLCAIPGKNLPTLNWFELISLDKWVHAFLFFIMTAWCLVLGKIFNWYEFLLILVCIFYGGTLEILQGILFVDRSADWMDFFANTAGTLLGWLIYKKFGN